MQANIGKLWLHWKICLSPDLELLSTTFNALLDLDSMIDG